MEQSWSDSTEGRLILFCQLQPPLEEDGIREARLLVIDGEAIRRLSLFSGTRRSASTTPPSPSRPATARPSGPTSSSKMLTTSKLRMGWTSGPSPSPYVNSSYWTPSSNRSTRQFIDTRVAIAKQGFCSWSGWRTLMKLFR